MRAKLFWSVLLLSVLAACVAAQADETEVYLGDAAAPAVLNKAQGWGGLGVNTAVVPPGRPAGNSLQIGEATFTRGLGHHAPGELVVVLPEGQYTLFRAQVGVHWQGGAKGSVLIQVFADGDKRFEAGPMSDSDAPQAIEVPLAGVRELRLVSLDNGDGIACDAVDWAEARLVRDPDAPWFSAPSVTLSGAPAPAPGPGFCGFSLLAQAGGPQVVTLGTHSFAACLREGESVEVAVPAGNLAPDMRLLADIVLRSGAGARAALSLGGGPAAECVLSADRVTLDATSGLTARGPGEVRLSLTGGPGETLVEWRNIRIAGGKAEYLVPVMPAAGEEVLPPPALPALRPGFEAMLIEWDWRMRDGIGTEREPVTYTEATARLLQQGDALIDDLRASGVELGGAEAEWRALEQEYRALAATAAPDASPRAEELWRALHQARRRIAFMNPLFQTGPLVFAKHVPSAFSHQLTQYYGRCARPGGGIFVLDRPGESMECRALTDGKFPQGNYMQPEVSYDGSRILFAYCETPTTPRRGDDAEQYRGRRYHLYQINPDGSGLRQLTEGPHDDFSPRELPDGRLMFVSTRRGGFHRCGRGPCDVYTLATADADGANPRTVSFHETNEWDPAVLNDGRVIYTRWDYVDRNAVHYQHLWSVHADGSAPAAYFGNNTFNPVGIWEAQPVPGSTLVMATAAAHHAMTAGSIILVDRAKGVDGLGPITRLTTDAPFPESETSVLPPGWHAPGSPKEFDTPEQQRRWPGHCYRSAWPLSERYFIAAHSFLALIGEPDANPANMFGLYLADAFGNRELIYRDLGVSSLWPMPLRARPRPAAYPAPHEKEQVAEGAYYIQNVYASSLGAIEGPITHLRIVQVLPKTTPHANDPTVGLANASPGKQVLGVVPVEADGSAYFTAPAGVALAFQILDAQGRAVQVMRSVTYLQPGETASCVGCHEDRLIVSATARPSLALERLPSRITPAPDGANPLSYPLLVQPVLDRHCVSCHAGEKPAGPEGHPLVLTGEPEERYTKSYNVLASRVPYSSWGGLAENGEPATQPGRFGARASGLMKMLLDGHHDVKLDAEELDRLTTWMDANALFYGTFSPEDQARQQRGERIVGPALQ